MSFTRDNYEIVRKAISLDVVKYCDLQFELIRKYNYILNGIPENDVTSFGDPQVANSFSYYSAFCFETLLLTFLPTIEKVTNKKLFPTYSYARIYYNNAEMRRHIDRPSCQYSATVCISNDNNFGPWDIWFKDLEGNEFPVWLEPGDAVIYKGDVLEHWRTPYKGNRQCQSFLHYVDQNGEYSDFKYDKRQYLGFSKL